MFLFCFSVLKIFLPGIEFLSWQFSYFEYFNIFPCMLTYSVSDEKSNVAIVFVSLAVACLFFWDYVCGFLYIAIFFLLSLIMTGLGIVFFMFLCVGFVELFWICEFILFIKFWKFLFILSSNFSPMPLSLLFRDSGYPSESLEFILQLTVLFSFLFCCLCLCFIRIISIASRCTNLSSAMSNLFFVQFSVLFISL